MGRKKINENNKKDNKKRLDRNNVKSKRMVWIVVSALVLTIGIGIIGFMSTSVSNNDIPTSQNITGNWMDIHGIGMYPSDNGKDSSLYLATHNGLFIKDNSSSAWKEIGDDKSDFMGFTINPSKEGVMYSSGHPQTGGNLGFRTSDDYGATWQKVSDVTTPNPIDFHTMTIGNNPEIIYAASGMGDNIFISTDEGKNWTITNPPGGQLVITLAANQTNSNILYAATTNGLFSSTDQGKGWQKINSDLIGGNDTMVTGIEISSDGKTAYAFAVPNPTSENENGYILKSTDGGKIWAKTDGQIAGVQFASKFAFGNNGEIYATVTQDSVETGVASSVFSSNDDGKTWTLEGTNNNKLLGGT
ncbi:MAG: hypothetical protein M3Q77_05970 [Thermoproteota archaeon]|nr:hypothetical protein [Thermoproteota archaeon]